MGKLYTYKEMEELWQESHGEVNPRTFQELVRLGKRIDDADARKHRLRAVFSALAVAAAAATLLILPQRGPKDTFDDPLLAYAEVEKTFQTISEKMSAGVDIAREASASVDFPQTVIDRIQSK